MRLYQGLILFIVSSFSLLSSTCYASYVIIEREPGAYNQVYYSGSYNEVSRQYSRRERFYDDREYAYSEPRRYRYTYRYDDSYRPYRHYHQRKRYVSKHHRYRGHAGSLPSQIASKGQKVIIVDPVVHAWGAYSSDGKLLRSGVAAAGSKWCSDLGRPCRTRSGSFRIQSLGSGSCKSTRYPLGRGGAPMPYCMYFNGNQGIHGSYELAAANISHGCVRISVSDARWLRYNFANIGTKLIVKPY